MQSPEDYLQHICDTLYAIRDNQYQEKAPDFDTLQISDSRDWKLDYRGYRYCYLWLPSVAYTLVFDDYGSGTVQPQQWVNLAMRPGTVIKTSGQATPVTIHLLFTDWLVQ